MTNTAAVAPAPAALTRRLNEILLNDRALEGEFEFVALHVVVAQPEPDRFVVAAIPADLAPGHPDVERLDVEEVLADALDRAGLDFEVVEFRPWVARPFGGWTSPWAVAATLTVEAA